MTESHRLISAPSPALGTVTACTRTSQWVNPRELLIFRVFGVRGVENELADLAAAHSRAKQFAHRIISFSGLWEHEPDWRHWLVKVKDDRRFTVLTVMFPTSFVLPQWKFDAEANGVHVLQRSISRSKRMMMGFSL